MATATVAAAGTALAVYYYYAQRAEASRSIEDTRFAGASFAPRTFLEDLYFFAEGLRYFHSETLGRWRTHDLLIGLVYLSRKNGEEHPVADIARQGRVYAADLVGAAREAAMEELRVIERVFRYCSGLRERRPIFQRRYLVEVLNIPEADVLRQELRAGVLKPSYVLTRDAELGAVVLAVRGTHSFKDAFTSLTGAARPHHVVDHNGVVLGYSHFGMLAAARWLKGEVVADLKAAMESRPGYRLLIVGHSLGGGTAAMLTMMLREQGGLLAEASCIAVACPACMTLELAKSCSGYVTTIINAADVIPTICPGSADLLREEVMQSSWFADFRQDMRASRIVKVVESSLTRVTTVTATATSWTSARLSACYPRRQPLASAPPRPTLKRRNSDEGFATPSWHDRTVEDVSALSPLSSSAPERGPAGLGLATRLPAPLRSWNWTEGVTQLTSFTGRQAQSLGKTMSRLTATTSSSGHGLLGAWGGQANENNAASQENENSRDYKSMDVAAAATQGSPPLSTDYVTTTDMQQRRAHDPGENSMVDDDCGDDDDDDYSNLEALGLAEEDEEGLEAEMAARMQEVRRAVRAAEAEENALQSQGNAHDPVPAIIRPGNYGECDQSSSYPSNFDAQRSGDHATAWRRQMYPAGRILHLIPAHLMHGLEKNGPHGHSKRDSTSEQFSAVAREDRGMVGVDANVTGCSKRALTDMDGYHQPGTLPTKARVVAGAAGSDTMMVYIENELGSSAAPMESGHARHVSEISMGEVVTAEEATGSARPGATGEHGPLPPLKPARGPPEPMVLLEGVPQECYARIRLCRTVLSDHVIPNYLRSLESFVDKLRGT